MFCCLKGRQRKNGSFKIAPPEDGTYYLKIYGKPEDEIQDEGDTLDHVATFLIHGVEVLISHNLQLPVPRFVYNIEAKSVFMLLRPKVNQMLIGLVMFQWKIPKSELDLCR